MPTEPTEYATKELFPPTYLDAYATPLTDVGGLFDPGLRPRQSLDGDWHFAIDPYDTCLRARWFEEKYADEAGRPYPVDFSFDDWDTTPVPSCWNLRRDQWFWYEGSAVYVRDLDVTPAADGERLFLRFEAAAYAAYVFLNGDYLGWHEGASTPFVFEVTAQVRQRNRLVVVVNNTRSQNRVPTEVTDWFNYGGLHRGVSLFRLPSTFIKTASLALGPDGGYTTIAVALTLDGPQRDGTAVIDIPELGFRADLEVRAGVAQAEFDVSPQLWSPDRPKLYDVHLRYAGDDWHDRIGFRDIRVQGTDICLNGQPIFLKGVCLHEESVAHGRSLTEAEIRQNFDLAKQMGCVYLRLAHYPHDELAARIADEVGLMLWEEVPVYWSVQFDSAAVFANADNQLRELITRDRNRASVIIWSVGNENPDSDARLSFMSDLVDTCRSLDPTRLVSAACLVDPVGLVIADRLADRLDILGINEYYGWYEPDFSQLPRLFANSSPAKPVIICEFGADAVAGLRGRPDDLFTEDHQLAVYRRQIDTLSSIAYVKGVTPWILYDFRCPRRAHRLQGYYNRKGLFSADKTEPKLAFAAMRAWYQSIG